MVQWVAAGVVLPTWAATAQAQMALSAAINVSGSFRALSQRMAKAYCQQHLQVMPLAALDVLAKVRKQAQAGAADLAKGSTAGAWPADLSRQLEEVQKQYTVLNTLTATAPSKASAAAVAEQADRMMTAAQTATESLEKLARARSAKLVDMAGRQRMLSQRLAKFYFYRTWELYEAPADMEMHLSRAHFTSVLTQLENSGHAAPAARAAATRLRRAWERYQQALFASKELTAMRAGAERVAEGSESVLAACEDVVALLVAQAQGRPT